jgi:hypothetical protein
MQIIFADLFGTVAEYSPIAQEVTVSIPVAQTFVCMHMSVLGLGVLMHIFI